MIPVYQFTLYDISTDQTTKSRRWATKAAIAKMGGTVLEDTMAMVDEALVGAEVDGMTAIGFNPSAAKGFQTKVTP